MNRDQNLMVRENTRLKDKMYYEGLVRSHKNIVHIEAHSRNNSNTQLQFKTDLRSNARVLHLEKYFQTLSPS